MKHMRQILSDFHFHTQCSDDAQGSVREYALCAQQAGLTHLGVANHLEWADDRVTATVVPARDIARHATVAREIQQARAEFPDLVFAQGIEVENAWESKTLITGVLDAVSPDYAIASVHYVNGQNISGDWGIAFLKTQKEEVVYNSYFDEVEKMLDWGVGAILGHLDLAKRYATGVFGPFKHEHYRSRIESIVKTAKRKNVVIEINTSGLFQYPQETYPGPYIFDYLKDAGISAVSFGSDAHCPEHVGRGVSLLMQVAEQAGISAFRLF